MPAGSLRDWSARPAARPVRQANKHCDSDPRLDDLIVSPLIGIAYLRRGWRGQ